MGFIEEITPLIQKYAPQFNIKVVSPIIAQAILESASGTSDKVIKNGEWRHNYFGLKWRDGRCAVSNDYFEEWTSEQRIDGSYIRKIDRFCKFKNMEDGVLGYFQWTNISNYSNLKGVTDPETYLINIKADKYATSKNYVENLMKVINKYNLTQYDDFNTTGPIINSSTNEVKKMKINIHAGHARYEKGQAYGAVGIINESIENRIVLDKVISYLKDMEYTVYDCTVDTGDKNQVLDGIIKKANANSVDLDVSIHFNSDSNKIEDEKTTGVEVYIYSSTSKAKPYAERVCNEIAALGFKNRGVKTSTSLRYLKGVKAPAMLIECCFVDDPDDVKLYDAEKMARAIVKGIVGEEVTTSKPAETKPVAPPQETKPTTNSLSVAKYKDTSLSGKYKVTATSGLNLRNAAGTKDSKILTAMAKGETVNCYGYYNIVDGIKWFYVTYKSYTGFCSSQYLNKA